MPTSCFPSCLHNRTTCSLNYYMQKKNPTNTSISHWSNILYTALILSISAKLWLSPIAIGTQYPRALLKVNLLEEYELPQDCWHTKHTIQYLMSKCMNYIRLPLLPYIVTKVTLYFLYICLYCLSWLTCYFN